MSKWSLQESQIIQIHIKNSKRERVNNKKMVKDFNAPRFLLSIIVVVSKLPNWQSKFVEDPDFVVDYVRKNHHELRDFKRFPNSEMKKYLEKEASKTHPGNLI